jgi:hypothetical protein
MWDSLFSGYNVNPHTPYSYGPMCQNMTGTPGSERDRESGARDPHKRG